MTPRRRSAVRIALAVVASVIAGSQAIGQTQTPPELLASRDAAKLADPAAKVKAYDDILAKYPTSPYLVDVHLQKIAALQLIAPIGLAAIDAEIAATRRTKTPRTPHEVLNLVAMTLMASPDTTGRAEAIEREAIGMLDEETYARAWQQRYTKHPDDPAEMAAQYKEGKSRYAGDLSRYELTLGRILVKENRETEAAQAFEKALAIVPLQGSAALALATLAQERGDIAEAYRRLAWAAVTGRLPPADRPRLEADFATLHPDAGAGDLDADLDRLFRDSFTNPVVTTRYAAPASRTSHVVLAEMFSGAGCVPCLAPDLSFEAMLDRYSRDELVVLMYHFHAPSPDPLSNASIESRSRYYKVNSAPTIYLDGAPEVVEGPRDEAPEAFKQIDRDVSRLLKVKAAAAIHLTATMTDGVVTVKADASGVPAGIPNVRLQIALVETLVRYSGENGQRFHPMVVRALGGADHAGFAMGRGQPDLSATETFDLAKLADQNLQYYDDYRAELKARVGLTVSFLEKKAAIDPSKVAVAAFVQDEATHRVLDAAWVTPAAEPATPVTWSARLADPAKPIHAGDRIPVRLSAHLGPDWHLYALTMAATQGPRPTMISLPTGQPFAMAGEIAAPPPVTSYDPNFDADMAYYEGDVTFGLPVQVASTATSGTQTLTLAATYQMCTARMCLPVTKATVTVPVTIK